MKKLRIQIILIIILLFSSITIVYLHKDIDDRDGYATSEACQDCHQNHYQSWKKTLHPIMFRPVTSPEDIMGDFEQNNPVVTFQKSEIEFVVGNKWEQVYVRMIDGEYYPFPAKWMITANMWVPYKVHDWKETPMSKKCNGCHTTGFEPSTSKFSEFGIGCEACHGPAKRHSLNRQKSGEKACTICHGKEVVQEDIIVSVESSVCGQCHSRGSNMRTDGAKGEFNFPVGFTPNQNLKESFSPLTVTQDKKGKYWWGNGIAKNRHQEYADWQNSKHSQSLKLMHEKYTASRGEKQDACLRCHSADYILANKELKPDLKHVKNGITCVVCHDPHGFEPRGGLDLHGSALCGSCHADSMAKLSTGGKTEHYPCPPGNVTCANCHMPQIVKTGGGFNLHSHAFKVVTPKEAAKVGSPSSCQNAGCHEDKSEKWAMQQYESFYPKEKKKF